MWANLADILLRLVLRRNVYHRFLLHSYHCTQHNSYSRFMTIVQCKQCGIIIPLTFDWGIRNALRAKIPSQKRSLGPRSGFTPLILLTELNMHIRLSVHSSFRFGCRSLFCKPVSIALERIQTECSDYHSEPCRRN